MSSLRRYLLVLLAIVATGSLTVASAASLGDFTSDDLGAGVALVASCDGDGVDASFTTAYFPDTPGYYEVTEVVVSSIALLCDGQDIYVTLTADAGATELGGGNGLVVGTSATVPIVPIGPAVDAREVTGVAIVITGLP